MPTGPKKLCFICATADLTQVVEFGKQCRLLEDKQSLLCWHPGTVTPGESPEESLLHFLPQTDGVVLRLKGLTLQSSLPSQVCFQFQ